MLAKGKLTTDPSRHTGEGVFFTSRMIPLKKAGRIRSGTYPIGQVLPREVDLAAELGVSRNTLREAMRALAGDGLVQRRKRPRAEVPEAVRQAYPDAAPGKWVRLSLVRHARHDGLAVSSTEVYLHPRLAELAAQVQPRSYSVFRLIEEATGERVKRIDTVGNKG